MRRGITATEYILDRVWEKDGCWLWALGANNAGYATANHMGRKTSAHRLAYEAFVGSIPEGYDVDHLCRHRSCMNPEHLEAVPHRENLLRGNTVIARNLSRTHCPQRHPYDEANTYVVPKTGWRLCRQCGKDRRAAAKLVSA